MAKMYHWLITYNRTHDNWITYAAYFNLKNLMYSTDMVANQYHVVRLCGRLFEGQPDVLEAAVAGINNVEVICCRDQQRYTVLLINLREEEVSFSAVEIDGKPISGKTFHQESVYGATLEAQKISQETGDVQTIVLKAYSVNVIRF